MFEDRSRVLEGNGVFPPYWVTKTPTLIWFIIIWTDIPPYPESLMYLWACGYSKIRPGKWIAHFQTKQLLLKAWVFKVENKCLSSSYGSLTGMLWRRLVGDGSVSCGFLAHSQFYVAYSDEKLAHLGRSNQHLCCPFPYVFKAHPIHQITALKGRSLIAFQS